MHTNLPRSKFKTLSCDTLLNRSPSIITQSYWKIISRYLWFMVSSNLLINNISKKGKIHVSKQRLYLMTLLSIAMILMLVSIAGGAPFAYITNYGSNNVSVINKATDNIKAMVMYAIFIVILKELQLPWIEQRYMWWTKTGTLSL